MSIERNIPDYLGNRGQASKLCRAIEDYWKRRGVNSVVATIETEEAWDAKGTKRKVHYVRSNIKFTGDFSFITERDG